MELSPPQWCKSSYSGPQTNCVEVALWRKSSYSGTEVNCVEVARASGLVAVRDSKHPEREPLVFSAQEWARFLREVSR
ncbi:DUF397 domain-containing protein [Salinactinospora qingdaonensis]|uniref:DUF397 domain-containing protein n=1 Tax=Salinactinospora qingdaonensis TaxID=702744 RepID=A0ABP7FI06_9ACTN